jgi:hypothetical protein
MYFHLCYREDAKQITNANDTPHTAWNTTSSIFRKEQGRSKEGARKEQGRSKEGARKEQGRSKEGARKEHGRSKEGARKEQGRSKEGARKEQVSFRFRSKLELKRAGLEEKTRFYLSSISTSSTV